MKQSDFPSGVAVIIGGSGGMGQAIAQKLAESGADVALTWRSNEEGAQRAAASIRQEGRNAWTYQLDLSDGPAVTALFARIADEIGPIHTVVQAAGYSIPMRYISQIEPEQWRQVIDADVNGFFALIHAALPYLRKSSGSLVMVSSAGLQRWPQRDALSVAPKAVIEALIRGIAKEEGRYGVRANSVALGVIEGGMFLRLRDSGELDAEWLGAAQRNTALKRFGEPHEVAEAVAFLASARASYITGQTLLLDGGYSL